MLGIILLSLVTQTSTAPTASNQVRVSTGVSRAAWKTVPSCSNSTTSKLLYNNSTQEFSCGTDQAGGGGGGAPTGAQYWTGAADGTLSAEKNLGALTTGLVINTSGTPTAYTGSTCGANQYATSTDASGALTCSQVTTAQLSGTIGDTQLTSNYSGVGACGANQWASTLNDNAAPTCTQPAFSNLSGSATTGQLPTIPISKGGTNLTTITTNQVWVGTASDTVTTKTLPSCSNSTTSKLLFDNSTQEFSCGTDQGGGGSGNFVESSVAVDGAGVYSLVVTGQAWVTGTSKIACSAFGTTADGLTPEAIAAAALDITWSDPVVSTGFTVWIDNPRGLSGTVRIHCTGA